MLAQHMCVVHMESWMMDFELSGILKQCETTEALTTNCL